MSTPPGTVFCAGGLELKEASRLHCLEELQSPGPGSICQNGQGKRGPYAPEQLPQSLEAMQDDPLPQPWSGSCKQEGLIKAQRPVPFLGISLGACWRQALPPFSSSELDPPWSRPRLLVRSRAGLRGSLDADA